MIYKSYDALGMEQLRDDAKRVLDGTYPNSKFLVGGGTGESGGWLKLF